MICDRCGKVIVPNVDPRYTIADNVEAGTGRHWSCHEPIENSLKKLSDALTSAEAALDRLRTRRK